MTEYRAQLAHALQYGLTLPHPPNGVCYYNDAMNLLRQVMVSQRRVEDKGGRQAEGRKEGAMQGGR